MLKLKTPLHWSAYRRLQNEGYVHQTVNHTLYFKDPVTRYITNHIESTWRHAKSKMPIYDGLTNFFDAYLAVYEFIKRLYCLNNLNCDPFVFFCNRAKSFFDDSEKKRYQNYHK